MKNRNWVIIALSLLTVNISCKEIHDKKNELKNGIKYGVKTHVEKRADQLTDKILPRFDSETPDTKINKTRFGDFLKVEITEDVKNILCYADFSVTNPDFSFSFDCNYKTANRIIQKLGLKAADETDFASSTGIQHDLPWWDKEAVNDLPIYIYTEGKTNKHFWFDDELNKAYYFEFDL